MSGYFKIDGKNAVVTGGNTGLGRAIAEAFASEGLNVGIMARNEEKLNKVAEELSQLSGDVSGYAVDVSDHKSLEKAFGSYIEKYGEIDILVNCAGIMLNKSALDTTPEEWSKVQRINLDGTFYTNRLAAKSMQKKGGGVIVNFASYLGFRGTTNMATECASKAGVVNLTKGLALEFVDHNIRVNAIAPGIIDTDVRTKLKGNEALLHSLEAKIPMKQFGRPSDIVGAVLYLVSSAASYITGQTIFVDGGLSAK